MPLQKRHQGSGGGCWRPCGINDANHFYIVWDCQVIVPYWQDIQKHINNIFGLDIPF